MRKKRLQPASKSYIKKTIYVATEGTDTEILYFEFLDRFREEIKIKPLGVGRSPAGVKDRIENQFAKKDFGKNDLAWIVVDRDRWEIDEIDQVQRWAENNNCKFALSNQCFEIWLILHFEDKSGFDSSKQCKRHFEKKFCNKDKFPKYESLDETDIKVAITRAKTRYGPKNTTWPRNSGCTTVYHLVERYLTSK